MGARCGGCGGRPQRPIGADECQEGASLITLEELLDFAGAQGVEVVGNFDFPSHEAEALFLLGFGRVESDDLDHRLSSLGDDEGLAFRGLFDEAGEVGLSVVDVVGVHGDFRKT